MSKLYIAEDPREINPEFIMGLENAVVGQLGKAVVGYDDMKRLSHRCLVTGRHELIVSVPGLGKTVMIMALGRVIHDSTAVTRQFVSDLMPSDIIGSQIYNEEKRAYDYWYGPLLGSVVEKDGRFYSTVNIFGADEINRANPKMQSAMLGAMQEKRVMIGDRVIHMPELFVVLATRNPIENEGTYDLPEAQLDRFAVEKGITYLTREDEMRLNMTPALRLSEPHMLAEAATDVKTMLMVQKWIHENVYISEAAHAYVLDLVRTTRPDSEEFARYLRAKAPDAAEAVAWGNSPRASQSFLSLAQAAAAGQGRDYVLPKDIRGLAHDVLSHRLLRTPIAKATGDVTTRMIVDAIVENVPVNEDTDLYVPSKRG